MNTNYHTISFKAGKYFIGNINKASEETFKNSGDLFEYAHLDTGFSGVYSVKDPNKKIVAIGIFTDTIVELNGIELHNAFYGDQLGFFNVDEFEHTEDLKIYGDIVELEAFEFKNSDIRFDEGSDSYHFNIGNVKVLIRSLWQSSYDYWESSEG